MQIKTPDFTPGIARRCTVCGREYLTSEAGEDRPSSTYIELRDDDEIGVSYECFSCSNTTLANAAGLTGSRARSPSPEPRTRGLSVRFIPFSGLR